MAMASYQTPPGSVAVIGSQYCVPHTVDLTVTKKKALSLSGGDITVTDVNGGVLFKVKGTFFNIWDKRVLVDAAGNPIVSMQQKFFTAHNRWLVYRRDSFHPKDHLFTVKKSSIIQTQTTLDVFLAANTSEHAWDFKMSGKYYTRSCTICVGGSNAIICQMRPKYTALGTETYGVTVYPNVDYAFIAALIAIFDEKNRDE